MGHRAEEWVWARQRDGQASFGVGEDHHGNAEHALESGGLEDLQRRAIKFDPAGTHGDHPVREAGGEDQVVVDGNDGHALVVESAEEMHDFHLVGNVEKAGGLIEQEDARLLRESERDPGALTLAAGEATQGARGEWSGVSGIHRPLDGFDVGSRDALEDALVRVAAAEYELADGEVGSRIGRLGENGEGLRATWRALIARMSASLRNTRPLDGFWRRDMPRSSVLFPLPLGPTIATISPGSTANETPSTATRPL